MDRNKLIGIVGTAVALAFGAALGGLYGQPPSISSSPLAIQNGGTPQGSATILNCSTNTTCTVSGGVATLVSALGAGGTCTAPQVVTAISSVGVPTCTAPIMTENSQSAAYTTVLADAGKMIYHPSADTTARTWTIDSNANVAYTIGTCISFFNDTSAGTVTIAITSDTLVLAGAGTTGSRTLAASGLATACKMATTRWMINGTGLT